MGGDLGGEGEKLRGYGKRSSRAIVRLFDWLYSKFILKKNIPF
jgi:hypothetical protein